MAEYIEREATVKAMEEVVSAMETWISDYQAQRHGLMTAITIVDGVPAADVVPVRHGRWRKAKTFDIDRAYECSICGDTPFYDEIEKFNYCRRCGARMDGDA